MDSFAYEMQVEERFDEDVYEAMMEYEMEGQT